MASVQFHCLDYDSEGLPKEWKVFVTGVKNVDEAKILYCRIVDHLDTPYPFDVTAVDIQAGLLFEIRKVK